MGLLEFDKLPINTLVGADWNTFRKVTARQQIDKGFKGKYRLTNRCLPPAERLASRSRIAALQQNWPISRCEMDPLVYPRALAEWVRPLCHNVFACDKHFGYTTTYQTVFPHLDALGTAILQEEHGVA